nr:LysR family transcriptional regulator [Pseudoalteromonas luteoviolacea]
MILNGHSAFRYSRKETFVVHISSIDWQDVQFFVHVARAGSARATAEALGVSHTTVKRRIDNLEKQLGTRLFERKVTGFKLTNEGKTMMSHATQAEDAILSAERQLQGKDHELSGEIHLTLPDVLAHELLMPHLHQFTEQYPAIDIEVLISSQVLNISSRESDIAVRILGFGKQPPEPLIGRKLATISSCFYVSDNYLENRDLEAKDTDACFLGWGETDTNPEWIKMSPYPNIKRRYNFNTAALQAQALKAGLGIAMLPCFFADKLEGVMRLPDCEPMLNHEVWLLSHPDHRDVTRLRRFREFLVDLFESKKEALLGQQQN